MGGGRRASSAAAVNTQNYEDPTGGFGIGVDGLRPGPDDVIEGVRAQLRGSVVTSGDAGDEPCPAWNAMHQDRAAVTARCTGTGDVVDAVTFARERDLLVAVRAGGHSVAGLSTVRDGVLIDLSGMRGVQVDPQRRLARVQGEALLSDVDRECQVFGLATPLGRVPETGWPG